MPRPLVLLCVLLLTLGLAAPSSGAVSAAAGTTTTIAALRWPDSPLKSGTTRAVRGRVQGVPSGRRVYLEQLVGAHGWHVMGGDTTNEEGTFSVKVPTSWYHDPLPYRVRVAATSGASEAVSAAAYLEVVARYRTRGKDGWWKRINPGQKWRYNPCSVITWRANLVSAKSGALRETKKAVRRLSRATGITFDYRGRTSHRGHKLSTWPKNTNLVVAWLTPKQSPLPFNGHSGLAGPRRGVYVRDYAGQSVMTTHSRVLMNANARLPHGFRGLSRGHVLMHELGHAAGLGHVLGHPGQIMSYKKYDNWQAGDLGGLRAVGKGQGCMLPQQQRSGARALPDPVLVDALP